MDVSAGTLSSLSHCLLALHEHAHELDYRPMQPFALEQVRRVVHFDAGLLAQGTIQHGSVVVHDIHLEGRPPSFMESWEQVKSEDRIAERATASPGVTLNVSVDGPIFDDAERLRAHCRAFAIEHALCTALVAPAAGLYWVMSLYRADVDHPFLESERLVKQALTPHVFAAIRQARLGQLRRSARITEVHGQSAAIATTDGVVLEADPGFAELVASAWPGWNGPFLPRELRLDPRVGPLRTTRRSLVVSLDAADGLVLVHVRRSLPADSLTQREREIAEAFSLGETHRELGERLGISPNTVRRHLANIYGKLGISSKVELDRMISGLS